MEIADKNFKNEFVAPFKYVVKGHVILFTCVIFVDLQELCPTGLNIRKKPFIEFESEVLIIFWKETLLSAENDLLEALCVEICERMFTLEKKVLGRIESFGKKI